MNYKIFYEDVKNGDIYVAIKGEHLDGHDYIKQALDNGAKYVIGQNDLKIKNYKKVKNTKKYLTNKVGKLNKKLASNFTIIGITGTKGKSTTAMITYNFLKLKNINVAYIGTLGLYYLDKYESLNNTTPDILTINRILNTLKDNNITHIVMEVSSHALCEKRINGLYFDISAFTNLSQDHLDYHLNMENYLKSKLKILKYSKNIILNNDDKNSIFFKKHNINYITVGSNADFKIENYILHEHYTLLNFSYKYNHYTVSIPYIGKHNIYNYLMAFAICIKLDIDILDLINLTNNLKPVKGRNEFVKTSKGCAVVDYAHSPNAVEETLKTFNEFKKGKIITIIGCGGNRDKTKRPIMGNIATSLSDYVIFTSDNPRDENPKDILNDITSNLKVDNFIVIENRENAIKKGIKMLKKNDILLILGKGHETFQLKKGVKYPFDDKEIALKYLS